MIVIVCGPSGAGKTTTIVSLVKRLGYGVIPVLVYREKPRSYEGPGRSPLTISEFENKSAMLCHRYEYNDSQYAFSFTQAEISCDQNYLLDYPGDYPKCAELNYCDWRGLLVLPPNTDALRLRLTEQGRIHRSRSAIDEYHECLSELAHGHFPAPKWRVFWSNSPDELVNLCAEAASHGLFPPTTNTPQNDRPTR